jgi:F-type H+-transporting ATPase subunit a
VPKTISGKIGCIVLIVLFPALCLASFSIENLVGFLAPEFHKQMPEISMAAEKLLLPFELPLIGHEIPNTLPATWLTMALLILVSFFAFRKPKVVPSGLQNVVEVPAEFFYNFVEGVAGEQARRFFPLVATFFFFIVISNWMGLLPGFGSIGLMVHHHGEEILVPFFRSANADLSTTIALAILSVGATQYFGLATLGLPYLGKFFNFRRVVSYSRGGPDRSFFDLFTGLIEIPVGILELISEFIKILSFSFRLFGNIFAGEVLLIVMGFLVAFIAPLPFMLLEVFVGLVQALIFAMLSLVFFMMATVHHGEESH